MTTNVSAGQIQEILAKAREDIRDKTGKSPEDLYEEREKRVRDAIQLKKPDRVPVRLNMVYFQAGFTGISKSAAFYDAAAWKMAIIKTVLEFEPDVFRANSGSTSGLAMEALDPRHEKWPGGALPDNVAHQAIEQEYMKESEYDLFFSDPTGYTLRYLLPRAFGALEPLSRLPLLAENFMGFLPSTPIFTSQEFQEVAQALATAGREVEEWHKLRGNLESDLASIGFPPLDHGGGAGGAPFDLISDHYRGMRGAMVDMYRCPDKLIAACEKILDWRVNRAAPADPNKKGNPKRVLIALHRGSEGFMSRKQFEKFYWPGLKAAMLKSIELGYVPISFLEGQYGDRLEYFLELPKGKVVVHLDQTDMFKAKEILGGHTCIMGNVPSSLLQVGSTQDVDKYCKGLIEGCGENGGFILTHASSIDEAKPENIKAMMDSVKKYSAG